MKCLIGCSGLGDWWNYSIESVQSSEDAAYLAWDLACELYESYIGGNGIRDISNIMEEEDCSYEDAEEIFKDERESWVDYWISFDIENKINQLLEEGLIDSVNQINNYTQWKNQD